MVFWETLLISCIPSIVTGIVTFVGMKIQVNTTIRQLKMTNEHELEKLRVNHFFCVIAQASIPSRQTSNEAPTVSLTGCPPCAGL